MMQTILFVDDDINLLQALQRMLRGYRAEWEMVFVDGPRKALDLLATKRFDVVVSDMRMPDLDGAQLLSEVERLHPGTVRVILSGYAEESSLFRSVGPAHQYLSKPCDPEAILALMARSWRLREILGDPALRDLAASLRTLPSPPDLYLRLTAAMADPAVNTSTIARLIAEDVAMTAELLKITNSSYFALPSRITTAAQAVRLLGLETVCVLVLHAGIFRQFQGHPELVEILRTLSGHGVAKGLLAQKLASEDGAEEALRAQAHCAGMMADIGALVLLDAYPDAFQTMIAKAGRGKLEAVERAAFGASHAELGAFILGLWGFADPVIEAVLHQWHPSQCLNQERSALSYVHLACVRGSAAPLGPPGGAECDLDADYAARLGLDHSPCVR
ncbi:histidine kinase [Rhodospirillum rubrum]|uniref:response regulator n=1 Tax=Rhodospirillum rubrum TaxID=1085 RepID=UPI001903136F|nr:response regulator [Rhodospirillum rubrum]MBK1664001.1 histidine kinase [Rhodospirillum rubrum]MBK1675441.1 histidine kinase [Rhodospirillum rubrum]